MRIVCPDSSVFRLQTAAVRRTTHHEGDKRTEEEGEEEEEEKEERSSDEGFMGMTPLLQAHHAMEKMEEFVHKVSHNTHTCTVNVKAPVCCAVMCFLAAWKPNG